MVKLILAKRQASSNVNKVFAGAVFGTAYDDNLMMISMFSCSTIVLAAHACNQLFLSNLMMAMCIRVLSNVG